MELTDEQHEIRRTFRDRLGYWNDGLEMVLADDPEYLSRYLDVATHSQRDGALDETTREFVFITVHCMASNFDEGMVRQHVRNALEAGATEAEIASIFKIFSPIGSHSFVYGAPIIAENIGRPVEMSDKDRAKFEDLKAEFIEKRGYWDDEMWGDVARLDIDWFLDYLEFTDYVVNDVPLDSSMVELLAVAADASLAHTFPKGLENHLANALDSGFSRDEVVEVFEIVSAVGIRSVTRGMPILREETAKVDR